MAADINDKFKKVSADNSYAVATTVKTARTVGGGTTLEAFDLSKWADATAVNFLTYRKTTDPVTNVTTVTNRTGWTALVNTSSNTLTNLTIAPGYTDLGHQVGDYIEPVQMSKWANDLVDGILTSHNQNGTLKDNSVATAAIANNAVTTAKVANNAITADKLYFASFGSQIVTNSSSVTVSLQSSSPVTVASLTVGVSGSYLITGNLLWSVGASPIDYEWRLRIDVNGVQAFNPTINAMRSHRGAGNRVGSFIQSLNAGDVVTLRAYSGGGPSSNGTIAAGSSSLSIIRV